MATSIVAKLLFRGLLPLVLLGATIVRFNGISLTYGLLLLISPLLASPGTESMSSHTGRYLISVVVFSTLAVLAQIAFQGYLLAISAGKNTYGQVLQPCSTLESLLRQIGLQRLQTSDVVNIIRIIVPDIAAFLTSILVLVACRKLIPRQQDTILGQEQPTEREQVSPRRSQVVKILGELWVVLSLALSGVAYPSTSSAVYFLTFLFIATWWACYKNFGRKFAVIVICLLLYSGSHLLLVYLYQFQFFQEIIKPNDFFARLFGLTGIIQTNCDAPWAIQFWSDVKWPAFVSPACILLLYYSLAFEMRRWRRQREEIRQKSSVQSTADGDNREQPRQRGSVSSERQVLSFDGEESLVDEELPVTYDSMGTTPTVSEIPPRAASLMSINELGQPKQRSPLQSILAYLMRQSYIAALIIMMVWSITYHSWLTFVYLLAACLIWVFPKNRDVALKASPIIVFYAESLLIIQYIYSLDLTEEELPTMSASGYKFEEIGLVKYDYPCAVLLVQSAFTSFFWLNLRHYMRELHINKHNENNLSREIVHMSNYHEPSSAHLTHRPDTSMDEPRHPRSERLFSIISQMNVTGATDYVEGYDSDTIRAIGKWIWTTMCKYWILVCSSLFLVIAIQEAVIYRIIYMILFLYFVTTFKMVYSFWRFSIVAFWWFVIVYSMIVLCFIYTYQFEQIEHYWKNMTGLSEETLADLGLEKYNTATLLLKLLTPTSFLVVIILQLHYFQKPFLRLSDINKLGEGPGPAETSTRAASVTSKDSQTCKSWYHRLFLCLDAVWTAASDLLSRFSNLLWRIMEVHFIKGVFLTIFVCSVVEVSAVNVVFVFLLALGMPVPQLHKFVSHLSLIWCSLVILAKMLFQLQTVQDYPDAFNSTCGVNGSNPLHIPTDNANYLGLEKASDLSYYVRNYIAILVVLAFEGIIWIRQEQHYNHSNIVKPKRGIIFSDIKRADADKDLLHCIKFFANYFFYKFGLELCFIMTVTTMVVRLDAFSLIYGVLLGFLLCLNRRKCSIFWPIYIIILAVLLVVQYVAVLGAPPIFCWEYPWSDTLLDNLKVFLYLPSYQHRPDALKLIADFFQLGFACLQWKVFTLEKSDGIDEYGGGDNKDVVDGLDSDIVVDDFTSNKSTFLDYLKTGIFLHLFWVTLVLVFIAGTTSISLLCLGYLMGVFYCLWFGQDMLIKPLPKLLRLWGILLGYNYFVLMGKCILQLVGCVYLDHLTNLCWLAQLLNILCIRAGQYRYTPDPICSKEEDQGSLIWDSICFVLLLFQLRIFRSTYFRHVVTDLHVQTKLAARGAELINRNLFKTVEERKAKEIQVLENIKKEVERLKERQTHPITSDDHYVVIRSGNEFMFEDESEEDIKSSLEPDTLNFGRTEEDDPDSKPGPFEICHSVISEGPQETMKMVRRRSRSESLSESRSRQSSVTEQDSSPSERRSHMRRSNALHDQLNARTELVTTPEEQPIASSEEEDEAMPSTSDAIEPRPPSPVSETQTQSTAEESLWQRTVLTLSLGWEVIGSILDSMTEVLNNVSLEHRKVADKLHKEKWIEKERMKNGGNDIPENPELDDPSMKEDKTRDRREFTLPLTTVTQDVMDSGREEKGDPEPEEKWTLSDTRIFKLFKAVLEVVISHSDLLCYFAMILNHLVSASLLSLTYPIFVFLWALLSVPRPAKSYWIAMITYTEAVVLVKYLFQFGFFPWNDDSPVLNHSNPAFYPPRIIGIERKSNHAVYDLIVLVCLFVHRTVLRRNGLWKEGQDEDEEEDGGIVNKASSTSLTPKTQNPIHSTQLDEENKTGSPDEGNQTPENRSTADENQAINSQNEEEKPNETKQGMCYTCYYPFWQFYHQMTNSKFKATSDVYAVMFLCDFINFFIIMFGYASFGSPLSSAESEGTQFLDTTAVSFIQENKVPILFLVMLLVQFALIIIDRAIYLRKLVVGKFIYQIFLVTLIHAWMFFILPAITNRPFSSNIPAQLWYFVKCIYFALSAYQIRSGYPTKILGNFLTKRFEYTNLFLFKGFLAIPFLLELRALMDWMWTDTTLALTSWLQMEDIYANIFTLKCWRKSEKTYPTKRGMLRSVAVKYGFGGFLLLILIFLVWFPLLLFALTDTGVYESNPPVDCTVQIKLGGYQPIFQMSAQQSFLKTMTDDNYTQLLNLYSDRPDAVSTIRQYRASDITVIQINGESTALWEISPPSKTELLYDLQNENTVINLYFDISFQRDPKPGLSTTTVSSQIIYPLDPKSSSKTRQNFASMINGSEDASAYVLGMFPRYMRVPATARPVGLGSLNNDITTNVTFSLKSTDAQTWWELAEIANEEYLKDSKPVKHSSLRIFAFSDRVATAGVVSFLTGFGIIGLYVSIVLVIGRFIRVFFSGLSTQIMFQELPNVDKILKLCLDIYMVRESYKLENEESKKHEILKMEEELFAKLLFLYRSPETLIKVTKHKVQ